jgi:uncharacterized membrane protein
MVIKNLKYLKEGIVFAKDTGEDIVERVLHPLLPKFKMVDTLQIIIGASILAVPVGFTEETWKLGESLPWLNIFALFGLSMFFITLFTQFQYHRTGIKKHWGVFLRRIFFTYFFSFLVVALIMTIIQRAPWQTDLVLAVKRVIIVTFPSSLSAVIADTLR